MRPLQACGPCHDQYTWRASDSPPLRQSIHLSLLCFLTSLLDLPQDPRAALQASPMRQSSTCRSLVVSPTPHANRPNLAVAPAPWLRAWYSPDPEFGLRLRE